ncbi:TetR/AcrR family transcriptional regulator [Paenibacillus arenosi]|uniref:TetR/AcrR family transcriptional regulator n=1 Tax=Paenibacillus arenosi TaxID=2774142 RepID=A0ABR9B3H9_9BACL|nr:TetR/AcrR family transcriptional regulator [Paenibacillus arenosi]MBD8499746.1 TetR/AcrR family transcriptional regulator [Paenibacillus arenosi]
MKHLPVQLYERDKILEACLSVFARHGYKHTSTGMLAEAAGISKALIFHHFQNKKKLYLSLLEHCYEKVGTSLDTGSISEQEDFFEALHLYMSRKFEYYRKHPDESMLVYEAFYTIPDELKADMEEKFGDVLANKYQVWDQLFEKVPLQEAIPRKYALDLIRITFEHLDTAFFADLTNGIILDDRYMDNLFEKIKHFCSIIRDGMEKEPS